VLQEFRDLLNRGSVIDVAVGFVMGIAFTAIVTAIVEGLVNPLIALVIPGLDDLGQWTVGAFAFGRVLSAIINFVAVGLVVFLLVRGYNKLQREQPATAETESQQVVLLTEIRDELKSRHGE
jgi:large conductance mechanosensitive channel